MEEKADDRPDLVSLIERLPDAVLFTDLGSRLIWANRAAEELFGWTLAESIGMEGLSLIHPDDLEMAVISLAGMQVERVGLPLELRVRTATGWRQVELLGASAPDGLLLSLRDLTDRRRWELAGDRPEVFRSVVQHLDSAVMVLEATGQVRTLSAAVTRMFGIDQLSLEGRDLTSLVDDAHHRRVEAAIGAVLSAGSGAKVGIDVEVRRADGALRHVAVSLLNLVDDPTVGGLVATISDVSRRAQAEEDLREANAVLAATLESVSDGILAVDSRGQVSVWNRRYLELWGMPDELLERGDLREIFEHAVGLAVDPDALRRSILEVHRDHDATHDGTIELLDGRVIECRSRPQRVDGVAHGRVWSLRDVTETRQMERDLERRALHDPLTGLANQVLFRRCLDSAAGARREAGRCAVVFIDLDDFKEVNDTLGHSAGDLLLVEVAHRISSVTRDSDTPARLGGDEFAMVLAGPVDEETALGIARRLHDRLAEPVELLGQSVVATASIGVAVTDGVADVDRLLRNADQAMYHAKRSGRNQFRLFTPDLGGAVVQRHASDPRLRGAAARDELVVHYQPIVDPNRGNLIIALEALVRWEHPERGIVMPGEFIPYAESTGLIDEIGLHVFELACRDVRTWRERFGVLTPLVTVNLSPHQVLDERLPDRLAEVAGRTGADPSRLVLEFTEGALLQEPATVARQLNQIRDGGIRLAIDDFGTGHSSLARLKQFPIDTLKIDRTFVCQVEDPAGSSLVRAVVDLAHALDMLTVAEGVETREQQRCLDVVGADLAQGFLYHRPMTADTATALLAEQITSTSPLR